MRIGARLRAVVRGKVRGLRAKDEDVYEGGTRVCDLKSALTQPREHNSYHQGKEAVAVAVCPPRTFWSRSPSTRCEEGFT